LGYACNQEHERRQLCYQLSCNKLRKENALSAADEIRNELNEFRRKAPVNRFRQKDCRKNNRLRLLFDDHKTFGLRQGLL
jgi:hypothetical protein